MKDFFSYHLVEYNKYAISVYQFFIACSILVFSYILFQIVKNIILKRSSIEQKGKKLAIIQMYKYLHVFITILMFLQAIGINVYPLLIGSGAILVGIGMGLQNLFLDFISGIIILLDRTIRIGDIIEVGNIVGRVIQINIRTCIILTKENKVLILPNAMITKDKIINYSRYLPHIIFYIDVGISYQADVDKASDLMLQALKNVLHTQEVDYAPNIQIENFTENGFILRLQYTSNDIDQSSRTKGFIRKEILKLLKENNIDFITVKP